MRTHHPAVSILEIPHIDVQRGDLRTIPFSRAWTPEQRLAAAVLDDAVRSWRRTATLPGRRAARLRRELRDWFDSDANDSPFSFVNTCAHLGLNPAVVRAHVGFEQAANEAA